MPKPKNASSYSLSDEAKSLLERLHAHMGLSRAAVLETAIRLLSRRELPAEKRQKTA